MQSVVRHAGQESMASLVKFLVEEDFFLAFVFCSESPLSLTAVSLTELVGSRK
jgi:hypothetical protein